MILSMIKELIGQNIIHTVVKIIQNSTTLNELLQYQTEVQRIGEKVWNFGNILLTRRQNTFYMETE